MNKALNQYRMYLMDVSYFSGKLEAAFRYKRIAYERKKATAGILLREVYPNVGLMKVPVVHTPDGEWLRDTTPILRWLDEHHPERQIVPADPVTAFLAALLEDFADEWLWRPALYYRWMYPTDFSLLGQRIAREVLSDWPGPVGFKARYFGNRQIKEFLNGDGMRPHNEAAIRQTYLDTLDALEAVLGESPYLSGAQPSIADFGFFASIFRHFGTDPTPAGIMQERAPAVYSWIARLWNSAADETPAAPQWSDFSSEAWDGVFKQIGRDYLPYLIANAEAWAASEKRFDLTLPTASFPSVKTSQYRVWCLAELKRAWAALEPGQRRLLQSRLAGFNIIELLEAEAFVASGLEDSYSTAVSHVRLKPNKLEQMKLLLFGTPHDFPK